MTRTLLLCSIIGLAPLAADAQLNLSLQAGYTLPTGRHHAQYADKLVLNTNYSAKKIFTFSTAFKVGYAFKHLNAGLGLELGNYQTKKETEISGLSALIPSTSFVAATGRYLSPHVFINYKAKLGSKMSMQAGLMTGILFSGFEKDNGILVVETETLYGIIPAQTLGVEAHSGRIGKTTSKNLVSGVQVEIGYLVSDRLNLNFELAARRSSIDARASVSGYEQPFTYALWHFPVRAGLSYTFLKTARPAQVDNKE